MHGHFKKAALSGRFLSREGLFRFAFWLFLTAFVPIVTAQAQTELGSEDDVTVLGTDGTPLDPDAEIKGFSVFGSTQAAYTGAVVGPGNVVVNGVLAVSSGAYFVGNSTFTGAGKIYINDGTAGQLLGKNAAGSLQWLNGTALGDNLGSHVATTTLNMAGQSVVNAASATFTQGVTASSFTAKGTGFAGAQLLLAPNVIVSSASAARYGGVYASTHIYTGANIYANNLYATKYYGDGSGLSGVSARNYLTVALPTVLNEFMEIGNFDLTSGAHNLYVAVTVAEAGFSVAKQYVLPIRYNLTGVTWYDAVPLSNTGAYSGNDFALEVKVTNTIAYLRLRRTSGATAGTAIVSIEQVGSASDAFTPTGGSGSSASNNLLSVTPLTQAGGNVGVGTLAPGSKLDVAGDMMLSGSMRSLSFNGAQGLRDSGVQDLTLFTSDLTPGPVIISPAASEAARFTADMKLGLGTQTPAYRLVVSSGAGFAGTMMAISTGTSNVIWMTGSGSVYANRYYGDGSGLTGMSGTLSGGETPKLSYWTGPNSLGNASMTQDAGGLTVQASSFTVQGVLGAPQLRLAAAGGVVISSEASAALGGGVRVSTNVYIVGFASATNIYAGNFYGNGSNLTGIAGDNLGNHLATQNLNLSAKNLYGGAQVSASSAVFSQGVIAASFTALGTGISATQLRLAAANSVAISSEASAALGGGVRISTNVYIVGFASATNVYANKFYGDGSSLTGMSGTLSGGQTPKLPYWTGPNSLGNTALSYDSAASMTLMGSSLTVTGASGLYASRHQLADNVEISSETSPALGGGVRVSTNMYIVGFASAARFFGDGSGLTGIAGDNLGNHTATQDLVMGANSISFDDISLGRGAADRLDLANGDSLNVVAGSVTVGGTSVVTAARLIYAGNGTAAAPAFTFSSDTNNGIYRPATDSLGFAASGSERARLTGTGLGLGTTAPAARLHISSAAAFAGNMVIITTGTSDVIRMTGDGSIYANRYYGDGSGLTGMSGTLSGGETPKLSYWTGPNSLGNASMTQDAGGLTVQASSFTVQGVLGAPQLRFADNVAASSATPVQYGGVYVSTHIYTPANVYAANLYASGKLYGDGSSLSGVGARNYLTVAMPVTVNDAIDIGDFDMSSGAHNLYVAVTVSESGFSVSKQYALPLSYNLTGANWRNAVPLSNAVYGASDFALEVRVNANIASLRLRRVSGTSAANAAVSIEQIGATADAFTQTFGSGASTASGFLPVTALTQFNNNVGVGTLTPGSKLDVAGNVAISGSMGILSFATGQGIKDSGAQDLTIFTPGSAPGPVVVQTGDSEAARFTTDKKVGIGTDAPAYRLVVSSAAGFAGTIMSISTGAATPSHVIRLTGDGSVYANRYYGDAGGLTGLPGGDNLGSHIATMTFNMNGQSIVGASSATFAQAVTASSFTAKGIGVSATQVRFAAANGVVISSEASAALGGGVRVSTNVYIVGFASATNIYAGNFYGNGSNLTGIAGDNLGNHLATQNLNLSAKNLYGAAQVSASSAVFSQGVIAASFTALGTGISAAQLRLASANSVAISSEASAALGGGVRISTNVYIVGFASATNVYASKFYGDGSSLTGMSGTLSGGQTPKLPYWTGPNSLGNTNMTQDAGGLTVQASSFTVQGVLGAPQLRFADNVAASSATPAQYGGVYVSTHIYTPGNIYAAAYYGSAAGLTGLPGGDNLGSHIATMTFNMNGQSIVGASSATFAQAVTASSFTATGIGVSATQVRFAAANGVVISSEASAALGGGVRVSTNVYIVGFASATNIYAGNFYGNGSNLTGLSGTLSGGQTPRLPYWTGGNTLGNSLLSNDAGGLTVIASTFTVQGKDAAGYSVLLSSGLYMPAGRVTANMFDGNGRLLTNLNATNVNTGTLNDARLSNNVALLSGNQTFTGIKTFTSSVTVTSALGVGAAQLRFAAANGVVISSEASAALGGGVRISTNVYIVGFASATNIYAGNFYGNGSNLTGIAGDNLGNHLATQNLDLSANNLYGAAQVSASSAVFSQGVIASSFTALGTGISATQVRFAAANGVVISSEASAALGGGVRVSTNVYIVGFASATNVHANYFYGNGANLTGLSGTLSGGQTPRLPYWTGGNTLGNSLLSNDAGGLTVVASTFTVQGKDAAGYSVLLSSGLYMPAGRVTANMFDGNGRLLTNLNATNINTGTLNDARLSNNVALLSGNQTFTGIKTFTSSVTVTSALGVGASQLRFAAANGVVISSEASAALGGGVRISTNVYIVGFASATNVYANKFYGDGSGLTGLAGLADDLGNHTAEQNLNMAGWDIVSVSTLTVSSITTTASAVVFSTNAAVLGNLGAGIVNTPYRLHVAGGDLRNENSLRTGNIADPGRWRFYDISGYLMSRWVPGTDYDTWGLYWDQPAKRMVWRGAGVDAAWLDLDDGNGYYAGNLLVKSSVTIQGLVSLPYVFQAGENGIVISTGGAITTTGIGHGTTAGTTRGLGAVELQSARFAPAQVASGNYSAVSGGYGNTAGGAYSSVSGGYNNTASANYSAVSGGTNNRATGVNAVVSGGYGNLAPGLSATVSGGHQNTAYGQYSWAGGYRSSSTANGAFTWSDSEALVTNNAVTDMSWFKNRGGFLVTGSTNTNMTATVNRGVFISGNGLVGISTGAPAAPLDVVSTGTASNIYAQIWRNGLGVAVASITSQGELYATLPVGAGNDDLGNHNAEQRLDMGNFPILKVSSLTITGNPAYAHALQAGANGVLISTGGAITTTGVGHGTFAGDPRGMGAVDLQNSRTALSQVASGNFSVISGGFRNTASAQYSGVGGGYLNTASGDYSVTAGGYSNLASGSHASVLGGYNILAAGDYAVAAGYANTATGNNSVVSGGYINTAAGNNSTIPGGYRNSAAGALSFAAGYYSSSTANGSFTWSDSQGEVTTNSVQDRTVFKNRGGFLVSGSTSSALGGTVNRGLLVTGNGLVGVSTGTPEAALDAVATGTGDTVYTQIWRDSGGVIRASMTASGKLYADITAASGGGDNLGNHTATSNLLMGANSITFTDISVGRGAADRLDLANGDSLNVVFGSVTVAGTSVITSGRLLYGANGTVGAPAFSFSSDTNNGVYRPAADTLGFVTNGGEKARLTATGLGLGNTAPAARLHISSAAAFAGNMVIITTGTSDVIRMTGAGEIYATKFIGDASGLTGVTATDNTKVLKAGDTMTGQLTLAGSSLTVTSPLGVHANRLQLSPGVEISSHTGTLGGGLFVSTQVYTPGLIITSYGELQSSGTGRGSVTGLPRGVGAVDLQVNRNNSAQVASGPYSVISGGDLNLSAGQASVVSGGSQNTAGNQYASVGGGIGNNASGLSAVIPGGNTNAASGNYSFAAGFRAKSQANGAYTWADSDGTVDMANSVADRTVFKNRGGFLVTGSTSTAPSGKVNRAVFMAGNGTVGISTGIPQAALDMLATGTGDTNFSHIWRDADGVVRASMTASGKLYANISGASGMLGDNLGNHTATNRLNMADKALDAVSSVTISGTGITGTNPVFKVVGSSFNILANGSVGVGVAAPLYRFVVGDGYKMAGLANASNQLSMAGGGASPSAGQIVWGDNSGWKLNLGTRSGGVFVPRLTIVDSGNIGISTQNPAGRLDILAVPGATAADMNTIWRNGLGVIVGSMSATGVMSATRFVGDGTGLTGVGDNLGNHTATANLNMGGFGIYSATSVYVTAGALSTVAGSSRTMMGLNSQTTNGDNLLFISSRAVNGSDWTSAGLLIKRRVDVTDMGYMRFGSQSSDPISFGNQNTELMRISNTGNVRMGAAANAIEMDTSVAGKVIMKVNGVAVAEMLPN